MKDEIATLGQKVHVAAQGLSHAALDAVAFMGLAQHLARGEADTRSYWVVWGAVSASRLLRGKEPAHGGGLALAAGGIGALIAGVLPQARVGQGLTGGWALSRIGRGVHGSADRGPAGAMAIRNTFRLRQNGGEGYGVFGKGVVL